MTDNTELQRVMRIRRLGRQIAASLPGDLDCEKAFQLQGDGDLLVRAPRRMSKPASSKAVLRAELEAALANYRGRSDIIAGQNVADALEEVRARMAPTSCRAEVTQLEPVTSVPSTSSGIELHSIVLGAKGYDSIGRPEKVSDPRYHVV
jgi:hypothetical protein